MHHAPHTRTRTHAYTNIHTPHIHTYKHTRDNFFIDAAIRYTYTYIYIYTQKKATFFESCTRSLFFLLVRSPLSIFLFPFANHVRILQLLVNDFEPLLGVKDVGLLYCALAPAPGSGMYMQIIIIIITPMSTRSSVI